MNHFNSKQRFGIRKIHGITGSVVLGLLVFSMATLDSVSADETQGTTSVSSLVTGVENKSSVSEDKPSTTSLDTEINSKVTPTEASVASSVDSESEVPSSETTTKPKVKNYNPKWDTIDESGNVVRDLNKYSDSEANKSDSSDTDVQPEEKPTEIKPVDKSSFEFRTTWDDNSTETRRGTGSNLSNNSLLFTYSNTEPAKNLYVTVSNTDTHKVVKSTQSEYLGDLSDGRSVYKIAYLNGASQVEFKSEKVTDVNKQVSRENNKTLLFEYKVYQNTSQNKNLDLNAIISGATELYSGKVEYVYSSLKQAGFTVTDKLTSVVETNVKADNAFRRVMVSEHNSATGELLSKQNKVSLVTGLNNAAYSKNHLYGDSVYESVSNYETPNHNNETLTVSGLPDGITPVVNHEKLADGSYKIRMNDLLNQPNKTTTLDVTVSDELIKQIVNSDLKIKLEYKLERLNKDGSQFIQISKDPYGFTLYSKDGRNGEEFIHNKVNPSDGAMSIQSKVSSGVFMSLVGGKYTHLPMYATYSYNGDDSGASTVVYGLNGVDAHFNKIKNTKATVYAFTNGSWVEVNSLGSGDIELPQGTKRVALSFDKMTKGVSETPVFDVSLDSVDAFKTEFKNTRKFLDLEAQMFPNSDVVTYMEEEDIARVPKILADRFVLMNDENWVHFLSFNPNNKNTLEARPYTATFKIENKWSTDGPSNPIKDYPKTATIDYFVHLTTDLTNLNPRFSDNVNVISETYVSDGIVYRIAPTTSDFKSFDLKLDTNGVTPINGKITIGTIDPYGNGSESEKIVESGSTYNLSGSTETDNSIDFGRDLKDNYVTTDTATVTFNPLREVFSKLDLVERDAELTSNKDTVRNYELIANVVDYTGNSKPIKAVTFGIPKIKGGTIFNLARPLENGLNETYSYELDNSGVFVDTISDEALTKVTKVRITHEYPIGVTSTEPYVMKLPLVLDEKSTDKKEAIGTLEFTYNDNTSLVTNNVEIAKTFVPLFDKEALVFNYYDVSPSNKLFSDGDLTGNPLYVPNVITSFKEYLKTHSKYKLDKNDYTGYNTQDGLFRVYNFGYNEKQDRDWGSIIYKVKTGTETLVKLDTTKLFEYLYKTKEDSVKSKVGSIKEILSADDFDLDRQYDDNDVSVVKSHELPIEFVLQGVSKIDNDGNETILKPGDILNVSEVKEIKVYYTTYVKLKARGFIYNPLIDSESLEDRYVFLDTYNSMRSPYYRPQNKPLYEENIEGLDYGKSVVVKHKEIPSKTVVEENDRFKRTITYSYTYHPLKDINGFKDNGTRTVAYNGADLDSNAVFFYDEHVDEKIEWKTKPLTVNYIDSETNEKLTSYTVQRLKDEALGEFDQEYPNYTFERSDFNSTDLMGDSDRTVNLYFKHKKATIRTEVYVDNNLVSTSDKEVNTLSNVDKGVSDLTLEHDNKVAKYVRTESDSETVGEEGSVTTVKHYYETVAPINDVAVNVVFKDGDTVVGSTLANSSKSGDTVNWTVTSNVSDTIDTTRYKPVNGDWSSTKLSGSLTYDSNKRVYTVEVPVTQRVGRIVIKYVDETGAEIKTSDVYKDQPVGTAYEKVSPSTKLPTETGYVNKDGKLYMRTTGYVRVTQDDFGPGTISEGDNVFTFTYKKVTKDIEADVVGKVPNEAPIVDKDVKELTPNLHDTVYDADPTKPKGETEVIVEGSDGYTITSTSYTHDENGKIVTTPNEPEVVQPVTRVVKVGTQPSVTVIPHPKTTTYEGDETKDKGTKTTKVEGKDGSTTTTITYTVNPKTGVVTSNEPKVDEVPMVETVISVGTKPTTEVTTIPAPVKYQPSINLEHGTKVQSSKGEEGSSSITTTYTVNPKTGDITETVGTPVVKDATPTIYSVGTKLTTEITTQPYSPTYVTREDKEVGYREVTTKGVEGTTTVKTTYTVNENTGEVTSHDGSPEVVAPITEVVEVGVQPKVDVVPIKRPVKYISDDKLEFGKQETETEGSDGSTTTTTTYKVTETGEVVANPSTSETVNPKEKVIRVGTKPKVDVEKVARKVTYLADATKDFGFTEVKTEGSDGSVTTTTTYTVNKDGSVSANTPTKEVVEAVAKVVVMGTKPKVTVEKTNYTTSYEEDDTLTKGETKVKVQGKEGVKTTTITYTLDTELGVVKENKPTVEEVEVVNEIISVGTKPEESSEPIPYTTEYRPNTQVEKGETSVKTKGENGKTTTTVTYTVDKTTGKVTEKDRKVDIVSPKNEVIEVGNKPTTEVVVIPSVVRYKADTTKKVGSDNVTTKGKDGSKSTTTTYNVDPKTGKITEVVGIPVITDQVETVVKVGAKPKEETSETPVETEYVDTPDLYVGEEKEVDKGTPGSVTKTTSYTVNEKTGEVTENKPWTTTVPMKKRVVHRGTNQYKASVVANYYLEGTTDKLQESKEQKDLVVGTTYKTSSELNKAPEVTKEVKDGKETTTTVSYELVSTPENAEGKVAKEGVVVNYYYKRVVKTEVKDLTPEKPVTPEKPEAPHKPEVPQKPQEAPKPTEKPVAVETPQKEEKALREETTASKRELPNTGTSESAGLGLLSGLGIFSALGLLTRRKSSEED